jgi:branched-chain amino acid transport system permease protein
VLQNVWNGLIQGAIYAVVALGYTMVYGILQLINFAHGEVLMVGAYAGVTVLAGCAGTGFMASAGFVPCLVAATLAAMLTAGAYGFANERAVYRPLRTAPSLSALIGAIGVSLVLQNYVMLVQGPAPVYAPTTHAAYRTSLGAAPWQLREGEDAGGALQVSPLDLVILVVCVALMAGLWTYVHRTRAGTAMRATSQDRVMAGLAGIDTDRVIATTFVIGSALAAVAGVLLSLFTTQAKFDMGFVSGMKAFTAAVLGGIGNIRGAMVGGIVLGLAEAVGIQVFGAPYKEVYAFGILLAVLLLRPKGLLGERVAEKV